MVTLRRKRHDTPTPTGPAAHDSAHEAGGAVADAATRAQIAKLELTVTQKIDGVLLGDYQGLIPGPGSEPGESREYEVGDDVRAMDWAVTARTTVPHVRQTIADRELETWLLVDLSPTVDTGGSSSVDGASGSKRALAVAAAATFGFLSAGSGNRVGLVLVGAGEPRVIPPGGGRQHVRAIVESVATAGLDGDGKRVPGTRSEATDQQPEGTEHRRGSWWKRLRGGSDETAPRAHESALSKGTRILRGLATRRGMIVVISDFLAPVDWERNLRVIAPRQDMVGVRLTDPLDVALPVIGTAMLQDVETGEMLEVDVTEQQAADYRESAYRQRAAVVAALRRCGAPVMSLRTDRDWVREVIGFSGMRRQGAFPDGERSLTDLVGVRR